MAGCINLAIGHHPTLIPYDTNTTILPALQLLVDASKTFPQLKAAPEFPFDVVELSRQLLVNRFIGLYTNLIDIFNATTSTPRDVAVAGQPLLALVQDLDTLVYTNENYLLSSWIADAKQWAQGNTSYAVYLEYQARNQITVWGPTGENNDYASKQWAGLIGEYYGARWAAFIAILVGTKATGEAYNATAVEQTMLGIGEAWDWQTWGTLSGETWGTKGDPFEVVDDVLKTWA